ncbi:stage II sporulation protein Q [Oikeobacillus pervagus]|uniref:Stage II sporulation protein Q n=1 Tax=Oikeobacillus pervagus TaxID=1325931 RepID=A0AAJ1SYJ3_9BACI|nr:M23 family metallopeptidase [Oikeobacillus pervagus]MDQ0214122.1 stage II sporulation protein Q [Oikeobacillus pervagus]
MREEEKKQSSQKMRNILKKRWVFPAIYLASAAILISGIIWYQASDDEVKDEYGYDESANKENFDNPAVEVNKAMENIVMPMKNPDAAVIKKEFYDHKASKEKQEAALVVYNNTYQPNTGIDLASKDGKSFEVTAALSGKVTNVQEDSFLGNVIEIEHRDGVVTVYQSVKDLKVEKGDTVTQGQVIAKAGQSLFNEEAGIHVHFEIRKDDKPINPQSYFNKPVSSLSELPKEEKEKEESKTEDKAQEQKPSDNQDTSDIQQPSDEETTPSKDEQTKETPSNDQDKSDEESPKEQPKQNTQG